MNREVVLGAKLHPGREPSDPPEVESTSTGTSLKAQVASFRTPRFQLGVPSAVLIALIAAVSSFAVAWVNKPAPPAGAALTPDQAAQLGRCSNMVQDVAELKLTVRGIEPQIGILLARTDMLLRAPQSGQPAK